MKTIFSLTIFLSVFGLCQAQTRISGQIKSAKGTPVANANILIKNSYDGTSSDSTGRFNFTTTETGAMVLSFSALNYEADSLHITANKEDLHLILTIRPSINQLETVTISAGSFVAGDGKKGAILSSLDIATTAGSRADLFAALQTLPGTQTTFSESGLFVRGGAASETKTYFDGMLVKSPFNATVPDQASRGRLSAFLFKGTSFSAGGYSAQYGQALSSALILESTDLPEKTTTGLTFLSVGGGLDQNIRLKNSALSIGGYYYNLAPVYSFIKQQNKFVKAPEQGGGNIQYKARTSATGMFKFYGSYSQTGLSLYSNNVNNPQRPEFLSNNNSNIYVNSTYKELLSDDWKLEAGFAYNRDGDAGLKLVDEYSRQDELLQGKLTMTRYYGRLSNFKFGAETFNTGRSESLNSLSHAYNDQISAGFLETDLFLSAKIVARIGLRGEYSSYLRQYNLAPRTSLGFKTGQTSQVSLAYGRFYQNPEDEYLIIKPTGFEQADHYILKYEINKPNQNFRIEAYYKNYNRLTKTTTGVPDNSGHGYAKGFEVFWRDKKSIKDADYWISYSFLDTKRNFRNYPALATPEFAARHTASFVFKQYINAIDTQIGGTYTFASGRTYVNPNSRVYLSDNTKSYNDLSLTLSHLTRVMKQFTVLFLNANNVLGFRNVFGYEYSSDGASRRAKVPAARRDLIIGLLMTIGDNNFVR